MSIISMYLLILIVFNDYILKTAQIVFESRICLTQYFLEQHPQ
jgi:hypothetical protein